ncbi:MAG: cobalamin biosynthesis protein CobD [Bacteroidaceae bacterium]|nr:cobalamin biosynthesis protein CobD [Bacteroidaceae bacterium]
MPECLLVIVPLLAGWLLDLLIGDPAGLPHPIVGFGKVIAYGEKRLNRGSHRKAKGAFLAVFLIVATYGVTSILVECLSSGRHDIMTILREMLCTVIVFYCLAGTTLIREVREVFFAVDRSLVEGRRQVARIVGRDTSELSAQEVRTAALETLAENLSDGVVAPLFWFMLLGAPGMLAYKMVNTLDSMIGYRTERYREFGCLAARIDDFANFLPARLTALLMILPHMLLRRRFSLLRFVLENGRKHASPNSGYPEAALAGILDCRFGGPHSYFGQIFDKPFIGHNDRPLTTADMLTAVRVNRTAEVLTVVITALVLTLLH